MEENKELEKETIEEVNEELSTEEIVQEEDSGEVSEYEAKLAEYEYRLEEALINIEIKENAALANEGNEEAIEEYKKAKSDYEALRKEYKLYKKENAPRTWWNTLPLRIKIFTFVTLIFAFPFVSWGIIYLWSYPYLWFYKLCSEWLNKLVSEGKDVLAYTYLGIMWYLVSVILIAWLIVLFRKRKKDDVLPEYKKTYMGFIIGDAILILGLLAYQIISMIELWF